MSETTTHEQSDPVSRQLAPWQAILAIIVTGGILCGGAVAPVQSRVDRLEAQQHESSRDYQQLLTEFAGVKVQVQDNTRILRRIEAKLDESR